MSFIYVYHGLPGASGVLGLCMYIHTIMKAPLWNLFTIPLVDGCKLKRILIHAILMAALYRYNESLRLQERVLNFDVTELKKAAAAAVHKDLTEVHSISKLAEGGFNRSFEVSIDGISVIARLPYPSTYPKHFTVASEVATINLLRSYGVPAPKILDYSTTSDNAVSSEYIIMEKVKGRDLGDIWYEISEKERLKILSQVGKLESVLFSIPLPTYGSIYHKHDLEAGTNTVDFAGGGLGAAQFCVGPNVAQKWWYDGRGQLPVSHGPCKYDRGPSFISRASMANTINSPRTSRCLYCWYSKGTRMAQKSCSSPSSSHSCA